MRNYIFIILMTVLLIFSWITIANADNGEEESPLQEATYAEVDIDFDILDGIESILDPEDNSFEEKVNETLDKYSNNPILSFFKKLIEAVERLINAVFEMASEAVKIEVD